MKVTALGPQNLGDPWDSFQWSRKGNAKRVHLRTVDEWSPPLCGVNPLSEVCETRPDTPHTRRLREVRTSEVIRSPRRDLPPPR